jgi:acyl carrier protein
VTLHERLEDVFRQVLDDDDIELQDQTTAAEVEGWDSLMHITLMFTIENEFGVQFNAEEFGQIENVGELKRSLELRGVG